MTTAKATIVVKISQTHRTATAKTDETGFVGFVAMLKGTSRSSPDTNSRNMRDHFHILPRQQTGGITMDRYIPCFILLMTAVTATAQTPIPRAGDSCPIGTFKSGDYCKPFKSAEDQVIIQKYGSDCPSGFYSSGNYCKQYSSQSDKEAIPREKGKDCPSGWYKSSGYCVRNSD
jgi:hypothetical protein